MTFDLDKFCTAKAIILYGKFRTIVFVWNLFVLQKIMRGKKDRSKSSGLFSFPNLFSFLSLNCRFDFLLF